MPKHKLALSKLTLLSEGNAPWAIPVFCLGEFLRVITHPKVFSPPFTVREAQRALSHLTESPSLNVLYPGEDFISLLIESFEQGGATGNLVFDAQIVAVCREHGVQTLLSEDRDFDRFQGVNREGL